MAANKHPPRSRSDKRRLSAAFRAADHRGRSPEGLRGNSAESQEEKGSVADEKRPTIHQRLRPPPRAVRRTALQSAPTRQLGERFGLAHRNSARAQMTRATLNAAPGCVPPASSRARHRHSGSRATVASGKRNTTRLATATRDARANKRSFGKLPIGADGDLQGWKQAAAPSNGQDCTRGGSAGWATLHADGLEDPHCRLLPWERHVYRPETGSALKNDVVPRVFDLRSYAPYQTVTS